MGDSEEEKTSYAFNIRTDAALGVKICKEAERRGESASFVFREAVREYLARIEKLTQESWLQLVVDRRSLQAFYTLLLAKEKWIVVLPAKHDFRSRKGEKWTG